MTRHRLAARFARLREARAAQLRAAQRDAGFTVLEALISFVIFAIVATTASYGLVKSIEASHASQQRVDAADVAQYFIADAIRRANTIPPVEGKTIFSRVGGSDAAGNTNAAEEQFTVVETVAYDDPGSCNSGTLFWVHVIVRQAQNSKFLARSDARVACPRV
jgi:type II secretory pathway component PulJ